MGGLVHNLKRYSSLLILLILVPFASAGWVSSSEFTEPFINTSYINTTRSNAAYSENLSLNNNGYDSTACLPAACVASGNCVAWDMTINNSKWRNIQYGSPTVNNSYLSIVGDHDINSFDFSGDVNGTNNILSIEWSARQSVTTIGFSLYSQLNADADSGALYLRNGDINGQICQHNGSFFVCGGNFLANVWYRYKAVLDFKAKNITIYQDGNEVLTNKSFRDTSLTAADRLIWSNHGGTVDVANISIYNGTFCIGKLYYTSGVVYSNELNVSAGYGSFTLNSTELVNNENHTIKYFYSTDGVNYTYIGNGNTTYLGKEHASFYYMINISTADNLTSPVVDDVKINFYPDTGYPDNISVDTSNDTAIEWNRTAPLNTTVKVDLNASSIEAYLSGCTPDSNNICDVPINVSVRDEGQIVYVRLPKAADIMHAYWNMTGHKLGG